jgi:hypothetical protein
MTRGMVCKNSLRVILALGIEICDEYLLLVRILFLDMFNLPNHLAIDFEIALVSTTHF